MMIDNLLMLYQLDTVDSALLTLSLYILLKSGTHYLGLCLLMNTIWEASSPDGLGPFSSSLATLSLNIRLDSVQAPVSI